MLDIEEVRSCYFAARDVFDDFLENELYTVSKTPPKFLTYFNYQSYCEQKYEFDFVPYDFNFLSKHIGGNLQVHGSDVIVTYDNNNDSARQKFTILHEIYHYFGHYKNGIKGTSFSQSVRSDSLSHKDLILEQEANFGASLMQIHDSGIYRCLSEKKSFGDICNEFSMSYAALHMRLMTLLVFEKEIQQDIALKCINSYRYSNRLSDIKKAL